MGDQKNCEIENAYANSSLLDFAYQDYLQNILVEVRQTEYQLERFNQSKERKYDNK